MPVADEEIITRFVALTSDAIANALAYREVIDGIKRTIIEASVSGKIAIKDLEKTWIEALENQKRAKIAAEETKGGLAGGPDADRIAEITRQYNTMISNARQAFREAAAEETKFFTEQAKVGSAIRKQTEEEIKQELKQRVANAKEAIRIQKELEKQAAAEVRAENKATQQAIAEYTRVTKQGYGVMSEAAQQYGMRVAGVKAQIQQIATSTGVSFQQAAQQLAQAGTPIHVVNQALKELQGQTAQTTEGFRLFGYSIKTVGDLAKVVFIGLFGTTVLGIFQRLIGFLKEATTEGLAFAKAIFSLEVGARALQRAGVDVTIEQIYGQIGKLQERFRIFTTKDLVVGTAAFLNLNRDMGFTRDQLFKLQDAIATLAIVNSRSMEEVQRTVALAISSGYTEGLQRLGVSINRVTIATEAGRLGFAKNYMALNEQQRALATYNLIIQKTAIYQEDLQKYYDTAPGAVDRTTTSFKELKNQFGLMVSTNLGMYLRDINRYIDHLNGALDKLKDSRIAQSIRHMSENMEEFAKNADAAQRAVQGVLEWLTRFSLIKALPSPFDQLLASLFRMIDVKEALDEGILSDETVDKTKRNADAIAQAIDNVADMGEEAIEKANEGLQDAQDDFWKDIQRINQRGYERSLDLARDYARDLEDIERDLTRKLEDLWRNYQQKRAELQQKYEADVAAAALEYQQDVADALRDFALRRAELERKYRLNEIQAERRFQEEMRKLREGFLFNLEDALRERDALQVLRLIRQYNLQKEQLQRQNDLEKQERKERFEEELRDLEIQKQERLRQLAEEYQIRLAELARNLQAQLEAERQKYLQSQEDAKRDAEQRKADRLLDFEQSMQDLIRDMTLERITRLMLLQQETAEVLAEYDRRLQEIGTKIAEELALTSAGAQEVMDALNAYYGPGGMADSIFQYYVAAAAAAAAAAQAALLSVFGGNIRFGGIRGNLGPESTGGGGSQVQPSPTPAPRGNPRQMGGEVYAGEVYKVHKDETYIPAVNGRILNVQQSQNALATVAGKGNNNISGKVEIGIALSDGLVGEIIENTLGEVSDVVFEMERKRK